MTVRRRFPHNALLDTTPDGLALIRRCERFAGRWYRCPAGLWTIGYGTTEHLLPGIHRQTLPGPITKADAERLLRRSLIQVFEPAVERLVRVDLTANQFSALVSFAYNVGVPRFARSTLLRKLNRGDYEGAAAEFERWVYAGGQRLRGLVHRRRAERTLFETPDDPPGALRLTGLEPLPPVRVEPSPAAPNDRSALNRPLNPRLP
ncbi:hypothetical protein AWN76_006535 [Rhodothermaceae bacterium RA]|nr:hypothetical protein AWN76_006535 [Rhodothermaceae bacterium RA]